MRTNDFYNIIELVKRDVLDSEDEYLKPLKVVGNNHKYGADPKVAPCHTLFLILCKLQEGNRCFHSNFLRS